MYYGAVPLPMLCTLGPSGICVGGGVLGCEVSICPRIIVCPGIYRNLLWLCATPLLLDALSSTPVGGVCSDSEVPRWFGGTPTFITKHLPVGTLVSAM